MLNPKLLPAGGLTHKRCSQNSSISQRKKKPAAPNKEDFNSQLAWFLDDPKIFSQMNFHGNTKWQPADLVSQALIFSWSEKTNVTDAFDESLLRCQRLKIATNLGTYQGFMGALESSREKLMPAMKSYLKQKISHVSGCLGRVYGFSPIGFDGSRDSAPRTQSNEAEFCASNYGQGKTAKYRQKQTQGMRRTKNEKQPAAAPEPQLWITMLWHMGVRLPINWRLGPSNSSERGHVMEMLESEKMDKNTLFCGDAGFVGYDFWRSILNRNCNFLVRVGANVSLLSENLNYERLKDGTVLCWPKTQRQSDQPPLRLRLVQVKIGRTKVWLLTSVLDKKKLNRTQLVDLYKMRWGIEVEFRGLKQTLGRSKLRCRKATRTYAELDWSIFAMAVAKLFALKEQIAAAPVKRSASAKKYHAQKLSLANTMRAIEDCLNELNEIPSEGDDLFTNLRLAKTDNYQRRSSKNARYRPKNPDKKPLGEPSIRKLSNDERKKLKRTTAQIAA